MGRRPISYLAELRANWRPLFAATFGLGTGYGALSLYTPSVIAPHLLQEFGWSKSAFAMLSTISLATALCIPIAGRLTDVIGVRRTAMVGIVTMPLFFVLYSLMTGPMWQYVAIYLFQTLLCVTTTSTVYSRIAVQYSEKARGLSLAIVASGPALTGAVLGPVLNGFIEDHGWRASYHALAAFSVMTGIITLLLLPRHAGSQPGSAPSAPRRKASEDYPLIFRTPAFWVLVVSMLLCNLPQVVALSQLKLLLLDNGVTAEGAAVMLSAFAIGVLVGRFMAGLALDRFPPHIVGLIGMGLPSIGLLLLASSFDSPAVITLAVLTIGFSFGAEGDIVAYIVARWFGISVYSTVMGLMTTAMSISASAGAALLSISLQSTGNFNLFLTICAATVMAGGLMFLLLGNRRMASPAVRSKATA